MSVPDEAIRKVLDEIAICKNCKHYRPNYMQDRCDKLGVSQSWSVEDDPYEKAERLGIYPRFGCVYWEETTETE